MATIRTTCPSCGEVELTAEDVALEMAVGAEERHYRFECPFCGAMQRRPASRPVVSALRAAGVAYEIIATATPITEQEIKEIAAALDGEDQFKEVVSFD